MFFSNAGNKLVGYQYDKSTFDSSGCTRFHCAADKPSSGDGGTKKNRFLQKNGPQKDYITSLRYRHWWCCTDKNRYAMRPHEVALHRSCNQLRLCQLWHSSLKTFTFSPTPSLSLHHLYFLFNNFTFSPTLSLSLQQLVQHSNLMLCLLFIILLGRVVFIMANSKPCAEAWGLQKPWIRFIIT